MKDEIIIHKNRHSMRWRIWVSMVCMQLFGVLVVACLCSYEGYEALVSAFDSQLKIIVQSMRHVVVSSDDSTAAIANMDAICGWQSNGNNISYGVWYQGDSRSLMSNISPTAESPLSEYLQSLMSENLSHHRSSWIPAADGKSFYTRVQPYKTRQGDICIFAAIDASEPLEEIKEIVIIIAVGCAIVLLLCAYLTHWLIGFVTRPLLDVSSRLSRADISDISSLNLSQDSTPQEIVPFIDTIQGIIRKLDDHRQKEKRMLADISHDIRTPLTLIKSSVELALSRKDDPQLWRQCLCEVLQDTDRIAYELSQFLAIVRLDEMPALTDMEMLSPQPLIDSALWQCRDLCKDTSRIVRDVADDVQIYCNGGMFVRLLVNLVRNALQYGPPDGQVVISVSNCGEVDKLCVSDCGGQLTPQDIENMTQRFVRLDESRSGHGGGSGLGLSIVDEIVRLHHADMEITSSSAAGTVVTISLPHQPQDTSCD